MTKNFDIRVNWLETAASEDELAATLARLQILIDRRNITEYKSPRKPPESALQIPVYYLAEWLAENWWVILFEPRKDEDVDDTEYFSRHSAVAAEHGFPLPALSLMPFGRSVTLHCAPRHARFANIDFTRGVVADLPREEVEGVLSQFIEATVERLAKQGVPDTTLGFAWGALKSLTTEEREFCELLGALGLSPNDVSEKSLAALEKIYEVLGSRAARDFCLAATVDSLEKSVHAAECVRESLERIRETKLDLLLGTPLPPENYARPSWQRGKQAAKNLRERLRIDLKDPRCADRVFDALEVDTVHAAHLPDVNDTGLPFAGAVDRHEASAKIALIQEHEFNRRFSAGRAAYLAWVSESESLRLVTNALTRDQQASRSFAAEILIPQAYLIRLSGPKRELHGEQIRDVARERRVMSDVAIKQAHNAGIRVVAL